MFYIDYKVPNSDRPNRTKHVRDKGGSISEFSSKEKARQFIRNHRDKTGYEYSIR